MRIDFAWQLLLSMILLTGCVIEAPPIATDLDPIVTCEERECPIGLICVQEQSELSAEVRFVCAYPRETNECNPSDHTACAPGMTCLIDYDAPCESSWCSQDGSTCSDDCRPIFKCQESQPPVIVRCDPSERGGCGPASVCAYDDAATTSNCTPYDHCAEEGEPCPLIACESIFTCQPNTLTEGDECALEDGLQCQDGLTCLAEETALDCPNIAPCSDENTDCVQPEIDCGAVFTCQRTPQVAPVFCHPSEPYACASGSSCQFDEGLSQCELDRRCGNEEHCGRIECEEVFTCQPFSQPPVEPQPEPDPEPEPEMETCDVLRCAPGYICELRDVDGCFGDEHCERDHDTLVAVCVGQEGTRCNPDAHVERCATGLDCVEVAGEPTDLACNPYEECDQVHTTRFLCTQQ